MAVVAIARRSISPFADSLSPGRTQGFQICELSTLYVLRCSYMTPSAENTKRGTHLPLELTQKGSANSQVSNSVQNAQLRCDAEFSAHRGYRTSSGPREIQDGHWEALTILLRNQLFRTVLILS